LEVRDATNRKPRGAGAPTLACVGVAPLANFAPLELHDLVIQTQLVAYAIGDDQLLLRSFIQHCPLSLRLT